jgi:hypothetical protein
MPKIVTSIKSHSTIESPSKREAISAGATTRGARPFELRETHQWLSAIIPLTMSNIKITHVKKTGGPSGIT